jgi:hypothetical protein
LAISLGFLDRESLINYEKREPFFATIKKARLRVQHYLEKKLVSQPYAAGIIFNLKNNANWKDQQDFNHAGNLSITLGAIEKKL